MHKLMLSSHDFKTICHGADLSIPGIVKLESEIKKNDLIAIYTLKNELICLGNAEISSEQMMKQEKGLAIKTKKVFMQRGTYPKYNKDDNN